MTDLRMKPSHTASSVIRMDGPNSMMSGQSRWTCRERVPILLGMSKDGDGGEKVVVWSVALRGAVVGLVTVILVGLLLTVPSWLPDRPEEFGNLGRYVMFLYATPVVILAVGWIGGWIARLRRPWAMAIAAPVVAWVLIFATVGFSSQWTVPVIVAAIALVLVSYAATAVLAGPLPVRHPGWIRVGAALLVVVVFFAATALHAQVAVR